MFRPSKPRLFFIVIPFRTPPTVDQTRHQAARVRSEQTATMTTVSVVLTAFVVAAYFQQLHHGFPIVLAGLTGVSPRVDRLTPRAPPLFWWVVLRCRDCWSWLLLRCLTLARTASSYPDIVCWLLHQHVSPAETETVIPVRSILSCVTST